MASIPFDRRTVVCLAKMADEAENYNEMVEQMTKLATNVAELTVEERKLLQAGYCKLIMRKRDFWITTAALETRTKETLEGENVVNVAGNKRRIELGIIHSCTEMLSIIHEHLIPSAITSDGSVFYHTMKGDCYRYRAMTKTDTDWKDDAKLALQTYKIAVGIVAADLPGAHPARLGLALSLALFYHEICGLTERAYEVGKKAIDDALRGLSNLSDEEEKGLKHLLECLDEKMRAWSGILNRGMLHNTEGGVTSPIRAILIWLMSTHEDEDSPSLVVTRGYAKHPSHFFVEILYPEPLQEPHQSIYIENLPFHYKAEHISTMIQKYAQAPLFVKVSRHGKRGKSRGYAFVTMKNKRDRDIVLLHLDGKDCEGRLLNVNLPLKLAPLKHFDDKAPLISTTVIERKKKE